MRKDIHPKYTELTIIIGGKEARKYKTRSTYASVHGGNDTLTMDIDFLKHPAWNKSARTAASDADSNVSNFKNKYGNLSFGLPK